VKTPLDLQDRHEKGGRFEIISTKGTVVT